MLLLPTLEYNLPIKKRQEEYNLPIKKKKRGGCCDHHNRNITFLSRKHKKRKKRQEEYNFPIKKKKDRWML